LASGAQPSATNSCALAASPPGRRATLCPSASGHLSAGAPLAFGRLLQLLARHEGENYRWRQISSKWPEVAHFPCGGCTAVHCFPKALCTATQCNALGVCGARAAGPQTVCSAADCLWDQSQASALSGLADLWSQSGAASH